MVMEFNLTYESFLTNFPPFMHKQIEEIFIHGKLGLTSINLYDIVPIFINEENTKFSYHFTLKIPYAGKRLSWEVMFNADNPKFAPDFDFNDDSFLTNVDIDEISNNIPSLESWNIDNPKCLLLVIKEFIQLYEQVQLEKLQNENIYSRIFTEYTLLTSEEGVSPKDVEVVADCTAVHFLIRLKVDYSKLPDFVQPAKHIDSTIILNPGEDVTNLKVSFLKLDGSKVNTSLLISPRIEQYLGGASTLHIPGYTKDTSLVEYVPLVTRLLKEHVQEIVTHHKLKKEYINYLAIIRSHSIIECDIETYSKGVFLCEVDDFYCIVNIDIGKQFPYEKPKVTLYSVYCSNHKKQCSYVVEDYPYSPRWDPEMMLRKLIKHLSECISEFKQHKH